jgi:ATP-dependent RNA helicase RhlE
VNPVSSTAVKIEQSVYHVSRNVKPNLLGHLLKDESIRSALVFTRTKHGADKVVRALDRFGVFAEAIHGNKAQGARQRALTNFKTGRTRVLVATDIAARGIDVDGISHVINFEIPNEPETYVHRIGRTGRAGAAGVALTFCAADERTALRAVERLICKPLRVVENHPYAQAGAAASAGARSTTGGSHGKSGRQAGGHRGRAGGARGGRERGAQTGWPQQAGPQAPNQLARRPAAGPAPQTADANRVTPGLA